MAGGSGGGDGVGGIGPAWRRGSWSGGGQFRPPEDLAKNRKRWTW